MSKRKLTLPAGLSDNAQVLLAAGLEKIPIDSAIGRLYRLYEIVADNPGTGLAFPRGWLEGQVGVQFLMGLVEVGWFKVVGEYLEPTLPGAMPQAKKIVVAPAAVKFPAALNTPEFRAAWSEYDNHRMQKKCPLTPVGMARALQKLEQWGAARATAAILHSIAHGWSGIFEDSNGAGTIKQRSRVAAKPGEVAGVKIERAQGRPSGPADTGETLFTEPPA